MARFFIPLIGLLNSAVATILLPLAVWTFVNGLDDLFILLTWLASILCGRWRPQAAPGRAPGTECEKRVAIFVPLWREHRVIGHMVEHNLQAIRYSNYDFFIGAYPNDEPTIEVVREMSTRFGRVHLAVCPHPGPTSKADCLNWIYQQMLLYELRKRVRFDLVVTHDAEDVIHPSALALMNRYSQDYDMVQIPVLPLPTPSWRLTHGVYCDEFAEFQSKDIPVRQMLGGFVPSNGVGTAYSRAAIESLAAEGGRLFDPECLTEDYENGLRLHEKGFRQIFVPVRMEDGQPVATREYFPSRFRRAVRQRTRWTTGIALQAWKRHGWRAGSRQLYWFWRDRKGLLGNPVTILTNAVFLYGAITYLASALQGQPWIFSRLVLPPFVRFALPLTLGVQVAAITARMATSARIYGWKFALGVPVRIGVANGLNFLATVFAIRDYASARLRLRPLAWLKTDHDYPASALAAEWAELDVGDVDLRVAQSLPARVMREWRVVPFRALSGNLFVAGTGQPSEALQAELRKFTRLEIRYRLVSDANFKELVNRLL